MIDSKIKHFRKSKGITQKELSRKTGISISYIQQLEYGVKQNPSLDTLTLIADALNIKLSDLTDSYDLSRNHDSIDCAVEESCDTRNFSESQTKEQLSKIILNISTLSKNKPLDETALNYLTDECYTFIEFILHKHFK